MTKYYIDGYTELGNPSPTGGGYTITDSKGKVLITKRVKKKGLTSNEAEMLGLYRALRKCKKGDVISTDSQNNISWVSNGRSKSRPDLNELLYKCFFVRNKKWIEVIWEPREKNLAGIYNENEKLDTAKPPVNAFDYLN